MESYLQRLRDRDVRLISMDIEAEFNLHVYGERFCLLQLADEHEEVLVDPDAVSDALLKRLLENRNLLKIMYDCSSDRSLLYKTRRIELCSILDLKPAVELLELPKQDLSSVLASCLNLQTQGGDGAKKRFQQYNWTRRPIEPDALEYAIADVRYLFELKTVLLARLTEAGLLDAFILENLKKQDSLPDIHRKPGVFRSGRYKKLSATGRKRFDQLYDIRERHAQRLDLPPNSVVANGDLFDLAAERISVGGIRGNRRISSRDLDLVREELGRIGP